MARGGPIQLEKEPNVRGLLILGVLAGVLLSARAAVALSAAKDEGNGGGDGSQSG